MDRHLLLSFEYIAFIICAFKDIRCYSNIKIDGYYIDTTGRFFLLYVLPTALATLLCPVGLLWQCFPGLYRIRSLLHDKYCGIPVAQSILEPRVMLFVSRYPY